jgi:uncharacterized damage-inducible protein DinB
MKISEFILKSLEENKEYIERTIKILSTDELNFRPKPHSNSIIFLMWHLARIEDLWINRILLGGQELYETDGWYRQFKTLPRDSGFGYDVKMLETWPVPKLELLNSYTDAVRNKTREYLATLTARNLDEAKDFVWSKGTVGSALSHLISEVGEHAGQIGYIKGILKGIEPPPPPPKNSVRKKT